MPDAGCVAVWHTPAWAPSTLTWRYGIADVLDFCADDVPVGDQDVVADRADGFEGAAPASDRVIARTQIGVLVRPAACAASVSTVLSATGLWRVRPDRAMPLEALLAGHIPAQDARCAGVANTLISTPISAIMPTAHLRATPGIVSRRSMIGS